MSSPTSTSHREHIVKFFCLAKKTANRSPKTRAKRTSLKRKGLGEAKIIIGRRDSSDNVKMKIREAYPKLEEIAFDLMVCDGRGGSNIPLKLFKGYHNIPRGSVFNNRDVKRISVIFIRPTEDLLRIVQEPAILEIPMEVEPSMCIAIPGPSDMELTQLNVSSVSASVSTELEPAVEEIPREQEPSMPVSSDRDLTPFPGSLFSYSAPTLDSQYTTPFQRPRHRPLSEFVSAAELPPMYQFSTPISSNAPLDGESGLSGYAVDKFVKIRRELYEFRQMVVYNNPGIQSIKIERQNFLQNLLSVYDREDLHMKRRLQVEFQGELGIDYGGLSNEYFWLGLTEITDKSVGGCMLFEGAKDHLVPIGNAKVGRRGDFVRVGKFIAHSIIHTGIGLLGLCPALCDYLTMEKVTSTTHITLTVEDLPDYEHQVVMRNIQRLKEGEELTNVEKQEIQNLAQSSDYLVEITPENAEDAMYNIMRYQVIERRKQALDDIKYSLMETGILDFVQSNPETKLGMFPLMECIRYPLSFLLRKIVYRGSEGFVAHVKSYLSTLTPDKIPKLLTAWTSSPFIPIDKPLVIEGNYNHQFIHVSTCAYVITMNGNFNAKQVKEAMEYMIENPLGFQYG